MRSLFSSHYHQCHPPKEGLTKLIDVTQGVVNLWEGKGVVPRAVRQWVVPRTPVRLDGQARARETIESVQTATKLLRQKSLARELDHQRDVGVIPTRGAAIPHAWAVAAS